MKKTLIAIACMVSVLASAQVKDSIKRLVPVKGTVNFRDVGGYPAANGKHVAWGKVYRSAAIDKLTDADVQLLDKKGIHTVVDFRGVAESGAAPDRLPKNTDYTLCPAGSDSLPNAAQMIAMMKQPDGFLAKFYGTDGVKYAAARFRPMFIKLLTLKEGQSIMYHCTGGRDRTGMATALFLYTLGVPQETIEADYVASNIYLKKMNTSMYSQLAKAAGVTEKQIEEKMALRPEYLRSFFDGIKAQYGSIENFLQTEMGIGLKEIELLRKKYTE